jgi:hypothetical protein
VIFSGTKSFSVYNHQQRQTTKNDIMLKRASLALLLIVGLSARAKADSFAPCDPSFDRTAGVFEACLSQNMLQPILYIRGPNGTEQYHIDHTFSDHYGPGFFLNQFGQVVGQGDSRSDAFTFFATYGAGGGTIETVGGEEPFLPGSFIDAPVGGLGWPVDLFDPRCEPFPPCLAVLFPITLTNLFDDGLVSGFVRYASQTIPLEPPIGIVVDYNWQLQNLAVPEPATALLLSTGLVLVFYVQQRRKKWHL